MENTGKLKILDCSLRDGGYYNNWDFEDIFVENYLKGLNQLPIDYVEIGYRSKPRPGYNGALFYTPKHLLEQAHSISTKKLAIIINEKEVQVSELQEILAPCHKNVALVRIAVKPKRVSGALKLAEEIKKMGFEVGFNVMYMSTWKNELQFFEAVKDFKGLVDYFYMVDSYGGVFPDEVKLLFESIHSIADLKTGFHAHNNLELALINTLTAISCGASMVDSTLTGMGRGAGNLKTELLLATLQSQDKLKVDYNVLSDLVTAFTQLQKKYQWGTNLAYMVSGANSLPQQEVMEQLSQRYYSLNAVVGGIYNQSLKDQPIKEFETFKPSQNFKKALIIGGGKTATRHAKAIKTFLSRETEFCLIHSSSKNAGAYKNVNQPQFHCIVGREGYRLEKTYGPLENSGKVALVPPVLKSGNVYVPAELQVQTFQLEKKGLLTEKVESATAMAIQTALELGVQEFYFVGYDGYDGEVSEAEIALYKENEGLFEELDKKGVSVCALTPSKYSELEQKSVFALL